MTGGDAEIFGKSIHGNMTELHSLMGVCPQHDCLWDQLTGQEHLELYATIKGVSVAIAEEVQSRLAMVKLTSASHRLTGGYSGGMRRRLSLAIAMLGDPKLIFLDERWCIFTTKEFF